ncbi:hypothetical protein [Nocardia tengchongensis]|uniref:hypothetical protein n=1 Tax=Nocardia tengchongensis TaxID=2055889 RepID=UPI00361272C0
MQYRYLCGNCGMWHDFPFCPFGRTPEPPRVFTPGEMQTLREIRQLERAGVISMRKPIHLRWVFLPMLALVVFLLLVIVL